ncbi:cobalt ABC transporter permease [Streptomyces cinereoruber]|uniref:Cobalt ABC transporter permease n=1 Tax=Streptomyces cinereoruber TaxID=67260 RepID=A0AAV4KSU3_9ACTN|nr:energy-coupling factor transporter transmembrane protein EcfT [Streptomyces cinereoruber]MBB4156076.1 energy-coupling factor transport system permease protein [Streptomyces cinereoruber]NIH64887.1 energy-coupling factor transport system permease protein [Streptomyces cinereoruber]GGR41432.1 cobalt ABC transporter permease [Streptomyces cinereoruber]
MSTASGRDGSGRDASGRTAYARSAPTRSAPGRTASAPTPAPARGVFRKAFDALSAPVATRANALHAGAWWLWALGLAVAASRTTNPLLLGLIVGVAGYVVAARRTDAPWARSYGAFVKLGLFVVALRVLFSVFLGSPVPGTHLLFTLPEVPLPDWAQGVRIGGRVTAEQVLFAVYDGAKLATLLICVGAANALANPARLLKSLPGALYEAGVAVVVAMTFAPNMVADVVRLRTARRLRGRPTGGVRAVLQIGLPVLEGALERSVAVAASMDARGYGRTAHVPAAVRRTTNVLTLGGLLGICAGSYGLLAAEGAGYGLPLLGAGLLAAVAGLRLGGRRTVRTRYRPDRWGARSWLVAGSGVAVAVLMIRANAYAPEALHPGVVPLAAPELPLLPALSILVGLVPAFVAPVPEENP